MIGTQARILITEWQAVAKLMVAHSVPAKEKPIANIEDLENFDIDSLENLTFSTADELPNILSEKQIQTTLQGPFGSSIKIKLSAYAKIARLRLEMHLNKDELFKTRRIPIPEAEQIPLKKLEKITVSDLEKKQTQLDQLTEEHDQEWKGFIENWTLRLVQYFSQSSLALTEREIKELNDDDIITEVLPRFIEVGLKLPKKDYPEISFTDYLYLKALLTTQSALSRQHLPHDDHEIQQRLKNFRPIMAQMEKQEQEMLAEQKNLTSAILADLPI